MAEWQDGRIPPKIDANAYYTPITGITTTVNRHLHESWKVSEQPVQGIAINVTPFLLSQR